MNLNHSLFNLGIKDNLKRNEIKRIKLLNVFSFTWFILELFLIVDAYIKLSGNPSIFYMHCLNAFNIVIIFLLQYRFKTKLATIYFLSAVLISNILFSNFIVENPSLNTKYFYIVIPALSVLFINNKLINIIVFILSYTFFILPSYATSATPDYDFSSIILTASLFLCVFLIVSFLKQINTESETLLIQKQIELERINKFQSQFFTNISHEIKTPITLINAEIDNLKSFPKTKEIKERIELQNSKIIKIVDDVLDLVKMKSSDPVLSLTNSNLSTSLESVYTSFLSLFEQKEIVFTYNQADDSIYIQADLLFLTRAINNLILNAYKYTPQKGIVTLKLYSDSETAYIEVSDSGIGIAKDEYSKVFNQFYQVDNTYNKAGGSGIGLFFTKQIIDLHKGNIKVKSKSNEGSTFVIEIPKTNVRQEAKNTIEKPPIANINELISYKDDNKAQNILIIDDTYEMRVHLKNILKHYSVFEAANGKEALTILKQVTINCIICDYMMPVMDGPTFVEHLSQSNNSPPILMLTAKNDRESKIKLLKLGVEEYITKPFNPEELVIRINNIFKRHTSKNNFIEKNNINQLEQSTSNIWINSVKDYLIENISNTDINQVDLAYHFNLSKSTFYRRIKTTTGLTPKAFITETRLLEAKRIIEVEGIESLKTITYKVGYLDANYFSKKYQKRFGKKPLR